jgi:hypothetical protein
VETGPGAHQACCPSIRGPFPDPKRGRDVALTTYPHVVPRPIMSRGYTSYPTSASVACNGVALALYFLLLLTQENCTDLGRKQKITKISQLARPKTDRISAQCFPKWNTSDFSRISLSLDFCLGSVCQGQCYCPEQPTVD